MGLYGFGFDELEKEATLEAIFIFSKRWIIVHSSRIPGVRLLGLNGAALAALGERPGAFEGVLLPLTASDDGVKLGESTLKRFFRLNSVRLSAALGIQSRQLHFHTCQSESGMQWA